MTTASYHPKAPVILLASRRTQDLAELRSLLAQVDSCELTQDQLLEIRSAFEHLRRG